MYSPTSHSTQDQTQEHIHDWRPVPSADSQKQEKQSCWEPRAPKASVSDIPPETPTLQMATSNSFSKCNFTSWTVQIRGCLHDKEVHVWLFESLHFKKMLITSHKIPWKWVWRASSEQYKNLPSRSPQKLSFSAYVPRNQPWGSLDWFLVSGLPELFSLYSQRSSSILSDREALYIPLPQDMAACGTTISVPRWKHPRRMEQLEWCLPPARGSRSTWPFVTVLLSCSCYSICGVPPPRKCPF